MSQRVISVAVPATGVAKNTWPLLQEAWAESTSLANWAVHELAKSDVVRTPDMERLPKMSWPYLYGIWTAGYDRRQWWTGASASANCIFRAVSKRYAKDRYAVVWQRRQALPTFRYPYPYRVHNRDWRLSWPENRPAVNLPLPGGRIDVILRSGAEYRRQLRTLRRVGSDAKAGELLLKQNRRTKQLVAIFVLTLPGSDRRDGKTMSVTTHADHFIVARIEHGEPWILNGDHVRRWIAAHRNYLERISEDVKHEKRWPRRTRRHINEQRAARCRKQNDRLKSWAHETTAQLIGYAQRRGVGIIELNLSDQSYLESFPWHDWREKLAYKCDAAGITLNVASGDVVDETPGTARKPEEESVQ